ncbi:MAG: hypothetical protein E3J60_03850 [Dehalococcoidia bacterium]|nr:MAG: hypothetical protein E3J60_03850 [Dehalococcoidia bacterium]
MPILIVLKNPRMNLVASGEIKDADEKKWDEIFHNQVLMVKNKAGRNTLVPLLQECNIAVMEEVTEEEIEEMNKMAEKRKKEMEAQGGKGGVISAPQFAFPGGRGKS